MNSCDGIQNRINELIAEISNSREDERNAQNQILQVISIAGAILGILVGVSYLNTNINKQNDSQARIMFLLSLLIFCAAFTYVIILGINNILRYYHMQNLEDRLYDLVNSTPDDKGRNSLLHWNSFSAPLVTRNPKNVKRFYTILHYNCFTIAACCVVLLSIGMIMLLFLGIAEKMWFDYLAIITVGGCMLLTFVFFFYACSHAEEIAKYAWDTGHEKQMERHKGEKEKDTIDWKRIVSYLIYPKKQDLQKPFLIILGYLIGGLLLNNGDIVSNLPQLVICLVVFDFLAYQARYQINDIRGLKEDKEAGSQNRLPVDAFINVKQAINVSLLVSFVKVILAITITCVVGGDNKPILFLCLGILSLSTILYEIVRAKQCVWGIFLSVGVGYPLRFCLGLLMHTSDKANVIFNPRMLFFIVAFSLYGSFSSILSWTNQVVELMKKKREKTGKFPLEYEKGHFLYLQNLVLSRYIKAEEKYINGKVLPMRQRCSITDPWNSVFICSISSLSFVAVFGNINPILLFFEIAIIMCCIWSIYCLNWTKVIPFIICFCGICGKIVYGISDNLMPLWYSMLSVLQIMVIGTYIVLCYQPQFKAFDLKRFVYILVIRIVRLVIGKQIFYTSYNEEEKTKKILDKENKTNN